MFGRWLQRNVHPHQNPQLRAVTLSFKRPGQSPGDATSDQLIALADLVDKYSAGEARVTHDQNVLLPWVHASRLFDLSQVLGVPVQFFYEELAVSGAAGGGFAERPAESYAVEFLGSREGLELNKAFARITDPRVRRSIVDLVRAFAGETVTD